MALTKKLAAGVTAASLLFTGVIVTSCSKDISGTFAASETAAESTARSETEASASAKTISDYIFKSSPDKESLFNGYEALTEEQKFFLYALCSPQAGGDDTYINDFDTDLYNSLSPESQALVEIREIRRNYSGNYPFSSIDISIIKDPSIQKALAPYVKDGYEITSILGENTLSFNGERLAGSIFFKNGFHIEKYFGDRMTSGYVAKATDELFQAYVYTLNKRAILESYANYDFTVTQKDNIYQVKITRDQQNDIEIEYDPSAGIMTYIIVYDPVNVAFD